MKNVTTPMPDGRGPANGEDASLLTIEQVAARLRIARSSVYELVQSGELQTVKIGRLRRVPEGAVRDFIRRLIDAQCA